MTVAGRRSWARIAVPALLLAALLATPVAVACAAPVERPGPGQLRHFSVLRTDPEGLPPALAETFGAAAGTLASAPPRGCPGANGSLAQRLGARGERLWIVPGAGCLELIQALGRERLFPVVVGFAGMAEAVRRGIAAGTAGVVPDGVIAARLSPALSIPVLRNVYPLPGARKRQALWRHPRLVHGATASGG